MWKQSLQHRGSRLVWWWSLWGALALVACGDDDGGKKSDCRRCEVDLDCQSNTCHELQCLNNTKVSVCLPADFDPSTENPALICNAGDLC